VQPSLTLTNNLKSIPHTNQQTAVTQLLNVTTGWPIFLCHEPHGIIANSHSQPNSRRTHCVLSCLGLGCPRREQRLLEKFETIQLRNQRFLRDRDNGIVYWASLSRVSFQRVIRKTRSKDEIIVQCKYHYLLSDHVAYAGSYPTNTANSH